jgi:citrate synthase
MMNSRQKLAIGLEGVPVAETVLSQVNGDEGRLIVAGENIEDLAGTVSFEEVAARLWARDGETVEPAAVRAALGRARVEAFALLPRIECVFATPDAMNALRAAVATLDEDRTPSIAPRWHAAARLTGAVAVFAAAWARRHAMQSVVLPDPSLGHAADFLHMLHGEAPEPCRVDALDAYFVTVADHGLNASTFAARVVASTGSDLVSAITAAIGALKGPLHGGAPGPVLDMLDAVGTADNARDWLAGELEARRRIMGMGHRVYRVRDPRAFVLERALEKLQAAIVERRSAHSPDLLGGALADESVVDGVASAETSNNDATHVAARVARSAANSEANSAANQVAARLELARAVEREATALLAAQHPNRALRANVEFYTAVLLETVGIPRELFSATFAAARTVGWTAHVDEERRKGRLIRPSSIYIGRTPERRNDVATR